MQTRRLFIVALCCLTLPAISSAADAPRLRFSTPSEHDAALSHAGVSGERHGVERSQDLSRWHLIGSPMEVAPGEFHFLDALALFEPAQFYRVYAGESPDVLAWMTGYPLVPLDGQEAGPFPDFAWLPFPDPTVTYRFEMFETIPDGTGGYVPLTEPLLSVEGLAVSSYHFQPGDPRLIPGVPYAWRVMAELPGRAVVGRPVIVTGFGLNGLSLAPPVTPAASPIGQEEFTMGEPYSKGDWGKLLEKLNEIAKQKEVIARAIAQNPLVEETELIKQLAALLKDPSGIIGTLTNILNDPTQLTDPEPALKGLCYLEALLEFALLYDDNMKPATKKALMKYKDKLTAIKDRLEMAADRQSKLPETIEELKGLQEEFKDEAGDPLGYLARLLKDKLLEKLEKMLAKKLGEKAAGAIISIISDLVNFADLVVQLLRLDSLCTEYNRLLLEGIARDPTGATLPKDNVLALIAEEKLEAATLTIAPKKMCWKREPDGGPYDGEWIVSEVPFADGETSKTVPAAGHVTNPGANPATVDIPFELDGASLVCPNGQGPCIVFVEVSINCPPADSTVVRLFKGVIRCP